MSSTAEKECSDRIAREFASELRRRLGDQVQKIILYGSRARGDFHEWSDFDFVVVVEPNGRNLRELSEEIVTVAGEILHRYDLLVSAQVLAPEAWDFEQFGPWGLNVQEEGVSI
ncbi:MAG: nucleotidyltransferase domain-containing protein [Candidatus Zixiibacteriota bacterium]|nr:MAG: nucleotidyltransferase domain-containing protein [candidate division Zixibacteria bacterium]